MKNIGNIGRDLLFSRGFSLFIFEKREIPFFFFKLAFSCAFLAKCCKKARTIINIYNYSLFRKVFLDIFTKSDINS